MSDNMPNRRVLVGAAALALVVAGFWREASELVSDTVDSGLLDAGHSRVLTDEDLASADGFYFDDVALPPATDQVSELKIESNTGDRAEVSLRLRSATQADADPPPALGTAPTDYPTLTVLIYSSDNKVVRTLNFTPDRYRHGTGLHDEAVRLSFATRPDDAKFKVRARQIALRPMT